MIRFTSLNLFRALALLTSALFLCPAFSWAAIANVQAKSTANGNTTDCSVTATSNYTAGNALLVFISIRTTTSTVSTATAGTDTLLKWGALNNSTNIREELWMDTSYAGGAAAKVTVTLGASSKCTASVGEYSGITSFGQISSGQPSGANPNFTLTTQDANDWLVVGFAGQGTGAFTAGTGCGTTTGNLRSSGATSGGSGSTNEGGALCDNSNASATSISETVTDADTIWQAIGLELRSASTVGFVQAAIADATSATFSFSNRAGNLIVTCPSELSGGTVGTPTDSASNTYTAAGAQATNFAGNPSSERCYSAANIAANTANTVTAPSSCCNLMPIMEFSGVATSSPFDAEADHAYFNVSSVDSGSQSINFDHELIVGNLRGEASPNVTAGSGFTWTGVTDGSNVGFVEWKVVTSCGSYSASANTATGNSVGIEMVTFKQTGAAACAAASCTNPIALLGAGCQ